MFSIFKKKSEKDVSLETVVAVAFSAVALIASLGVLRWSWVLLDEQVQLRKDFMEFQNNQVQMKLQFDAWDEKATAQRQELRDMMAQLQGKAPTKK